MSEEQTIDPALLEATDQAVTRVLGGEPSAHPIAALTAAGMSATLPQSVASLHTEAILRGDLPASAQPARRRGRSGRKGLVALLAAMMVLGSSTGALAAAQGATPGDPLYGLKRASEGWRVALTASPEGKAALHLSFAERRVTEMRQLVARGANPAVLEDDYGQSLSAAEEQASSAVALGHDVDALLAKIESKIGALVERLATILDRAPEPAHDGLERAIDNAEKAKERIGVERRGPRPEGGPDSGPGKGGGRPSETSEPSDSPSPGNSAGKGKPASKPRKK